MLEISIPIAVLCGAAFGVSSILREKHLRLRLKTMASELDPLTEENQTLRAGFDTVVRNKKLLSERMDQAIAMISRDYANNSSPISRILKGFDPGKPYGTHAYSPYTIPKDYSTAVYHALIPEGLKNFAAWVKQWPPSQKDYDNIFANSSVARCLSDCNITPKDFLEKFFPEMSK